MRTALAAALAAVALCAFAPSTLAAESPAANWPWAHTRCTTDACRALVTEGASQSGYLRGLLEELERSDVIVHIVVLRGQRQGGAEKHAAWLSFTTAADKVRYLRVTLDIWQAGYWDTIPLLAHELQHAVEVAREPGVRDNEAFERLYQRIGWGSGAGAFETDEARATARAVRAELEWARRTRPGTPRQ